jgi:hypothetical protein
VVTDRFNPALRDPVEKTWVAFGRFDLNRECGRPSDK